MSDPQHPKPPNRLKAALSPSEAQSGPHLKPHRHAAITTELSTYRRYKAWEEKIRRLSKVDP